MVDELLKSLGVSASAYQGGNHAVYTPIDGSQIGQVTLEGPEAVRGKIDVAHKAFLAWRDVPAPRRGELVRLFGEVLRKATRPDEAAAAA